MFRMNSKNELKEREKELKCLYAISSIVETKGLSVGELLQKLVLILPPAFQYPEIACAKIKIEDNEYKTPNFKESSWKLGTVVIIEGNIAGSIEVFYLEGEIKNNKDPFLIQERNLLDSVSERLGRIIERIRAEKNLIQKINEIEKINTLMIDRELKMIELKKEIERLKNTIN